MGARTNADPSKRWYQTGPVGVLLRLTGKKPVQVAGKTA